MSVCGTDQESKELMKLQTHYCHPTFFRQVRHRPCFVPNISAIIGENLLQHASDVLLDTPLRQNRSSASSGSSFTILASIESSSRSQRRHCWEKTDFRFFKITTLLEIYAGMLDHRDTSVYLYFALQRHIPEYTGWPCNSMVLSETLGDCLKEAT